LLNLSASGNLHLGESGQHLCESGQEAFGSTGTSDDYVAAALIQKPFFSPPKSKQTSAAGGASMSRRGSGSFDDLNLEHFATM
jgi:hypothetical protein